MNWTELTRESVFSGTNAIILIVLIVKKLLGSQRTGKMQIEDDSQGTPDFGGPKPNLGGCMLHRHNRFAI